MRYIAIALPGHTLPTGAILVALIVVFGPISGADFNPAVTLPFAWREEIAPMGRTLDVAARFVGGISGLLVARILFDNASFDPSTEPRTGGAGNGLANSSPCRWSRQRLPRSSFAGFWKRPGPIRDVAERPMS